MKNKNIENINKEDKQIEISRSLTKETSKKGKTHYQIQEEPHWRYETAAYMSQINARTDLELIQNHDRFGLTPEEMVAYLATYQSYYESLLPKMEGLKARYPQLHHMMTPQEDSNPILSALVIYLDPLYNKANLTKHDIDEAIAKFLLGCIDDNLKDDNNPAFLIQDISTLMHALNVTTLDDKTKLELITLYSDRYHLVPQMMSFLDEGASYLQDQKHLISAHYQAAISSMKQMDKIDLRRLKLNNATPTIIYPSIFYCNQISVTQTEGSQTQTLWIGIYVAYLSSQKEAHRYQSEDLIASLKALADPTRWKILGALVKQPMYMQEIANTLQLTPATISHHLNLLVNASFLNIVVDATKSKKVYYETNGNQFTKLAAVIASFGQEDSHETN